MIEAVLFDLDGTLADTAPDMARTVNILLERHGLPAVAAERVRPFVSQGARGMICSAFGITPEDPAFGALREEFLQVYEGNLNVETCLFPGMEALLQSLERQGIAWGVVTNKFERLARPVIEGLGLSDRARVIVGGDTCARPKPYPDSLLFASERLGVAPDRTLYIGDDARDVKAARAAGMAVIVAGYGYLGDGPDPSEWGADEILQNVHEMQAWIDSRAAKPDARIAS